MEVQTCSEREFQSYALSNRHPGENSRPYGLLLLKRPHEIVLSIQSFFVSGIPVRTVLPATRRIADEARIVIPGAHVHGMHGSKRNTLFCHMCYYSNSVSQEFYILCLHIFILVVIVFIVIVNIRIELTNLYESVSVQIGLNACAKFRPLSACG